jgi:hypothetical protein
MVLHFTDAVHRAKEQPLRVHFGSATEAEAIESMRVANVGERGFHCAESGAVLMVALIGADLALYLFQILLRGVGRFTKKERHLSYGCAIGMAQTSRPKRTMATCQLRRAKATVTCSQHLNTSRCNNCGSDVTVPPMSRPKKQHGGLQRPWVDPRPNALARHRQAHPIVLPEKIT